MAVAAAPILTPALVWPDARGKRCETAITPRISIGRAPGNEVLLSHDPLVSRRHCVIELRDGQLWIFDVGSRFGTFVNGERLTAERRISNGDQVRIVQDGGAAQLPARLEAGLPQGMARVPAGLAQTASLGAAFGTLSISKV